MDRRGKRNIFAAALRPKNRDSVSMNSYASSQVPSNPLALQHPYPPQCKCYILLQDLDELLDGVVTRDTLFQFIANSQRPNCPYHSADWHNSRRPGGIYSGDRRVSLAPTIPVESRDSDSGLHVGGPYASSQTSDPASVTSNHPAVPVRTVLDPSEKGTLVALSPSGSRAIVGVKVGKEDYFWRQSDDPATGPTSSRYPAQVKSEIRHLVLSENSRAVAGDRQVVFWPINSGAITLPPFSSLITACAVSSDGYSICIATSGVHLMSSTVNGNTIEHHGKVQLFTFKGGRSFPANEDFHYPYKLRMLEGKAATDYSVSAIAFSRDGIALASYTGGTRAQSARKIEITLFSEGWEYQAPPSQTNERRIGIPAETSQSFISMMAYDRTGSDIAFAISHGPQSTSSVYVLNLQGQRTLVEISRAIAPNVIHDIAISSGGREIAIVGEKEIWLAVRAEYASTRRYTARKEQVPNELKFDRGPRQAAVAIYSCDDGRGGSRTIARVVDRKWDLAEFSFYP